MGNIRIDAEDLSISPSPEKVRSDTDRKRRKPAAFIATFIIMAGFWILFSGRFDVFHLALGAVSCLLVAAISSDLLFPADTPIERAHREATEIEAAIKEEVAVPATIMTHLESIEEHEEVHQELKQDAD